MGESLRDVAPTPAPLTDRELSRRFTELADKKTTLEVKLGKHEGQVKEGREMELVVVTDQVEDVRDQLVRPRATEVLGMKTLKKEEERKSGRKVGGSSGSGGKECVEGFGQEAEKGPILVPRC